MSLIRSLLVLFVLSGVLPASGETVIVESVPQGQNHSLYSEPSGKWMTSHNPPGATKSQAPGLTDSKLCGSRKVLFQPSDKNASGTTAPAVARFRHGLTGRKHLYVYATWPESANARPVYYDVHHAKGTTTIKTVQTGNGGGYASNANRWMLLGDFDFKGTDEEGVEVRLEKDTAALHINWSGQIFADAIMFRTDREARAVKVQEDIKPSVAVPVPAPVLNWLGSSTEARKIAARNSKPILILFTLPESKVCRKYEREVFTDPAVKKLLSKYVLVKLDLEKEKQLARAIQVFKAGTICTFSDSGAPLGKFVEEMSVKEFLIELD